MKKRSNIRLLIATLNLILFSLFFVALNKELYLLMFSIITIMTLFITVDIILLFQIRKRKAYIKYIDEQIKMFYLLIYQYQRASVSDKKHSFNTYKSLCLLPDPPRGREKWEALLKNYRHLATSVKYLADSNQVIWWNYSKALRSLDLDILYQDKINFLEALKKELS